MCVCADANDKRFLQTTRSSKSFAVRATSENADVEEIVKDLQEKVSLKVFHAILEKYLCRLMSSKIKFLRRQILPSARALVSFLIQNYVMGVQL